MTPIQKQRMAAALCTVGLALVSGPVLAGQAGADQSDRAVDSMALYSRGAAVVQDSRRVDLTKGQQTLDWPVTGQLRANTLWLSGQGVRLTDFQWLARQASTDDPLLGRVGKPVILTPDNAGKPTAGQLVAVHGDIAYVRVAGTIRRITPAAPVQLSWKIEPGSKRVAAGGRLRLDVDAASAGPRKVTATYQITAPSWQASYAGRFDPDTGQLTLQSHAVIDNSGGRNALSARRAWLVAGRIARAGSGRPRPLLMATSRAARNAGAAKPAQAVADVYRYRLANGLHVPAGATTTLALMKPATLQAKRHYRMQEYALRDTGARRQHAQVALSFSNGDQPLPAGPIRIYDAAHTAQLMGGTRLPDTPAGGPVRLALGAAFDLTGTHNISHPASHGGRKKTRVKVVLFNAGKSDKHVAIVERLPSNARLAAGAPSPDGGSSREPAWQVLVPAHGQQSFSYAFTQP